MIQTKDTQFMVGDEEICSILLVYSAYAWPSNNFKEMADDGEYMIYVAIIWLEQTCVTLASWKKRALKDLKMSRI